VDITKLSANNVDLTQLHGNLVTEKTILSYKCKIHNLGYCNCGLM
jgi:hypothetical protein